ncbi:MAG: T9SS type A sorting domain-containing protein [Flavobacteriaceae bacterium]
MKYVVILCCLVFSLKSFSQEEELYYYDWRLYGLNIDGQNYSPPSNGEVSDVILEFRNNPESLITNVCNNLEGELVYDNTNINFTFPNGTTTTLIECENPDNSTFEVLYFNFFNDNINTPFPYLVGHVDFPEWWFLIIYNENGDYAEYEQYILSSNDNSILDFSLLPNPTETEFYISTTSKLGDYSVLLYDITGKLILSEEKRSLNKPINIQYLKTGIYFVSISDESGNVSVKKIIKK